MPTVEELRNMRMGCLAIRAEMEAEELRLREHQGQQLSPHLEEAVACRRRAVMHQLVMNFRLEMAVDLQLKTAEQEAARAAVVWS